MVQGASAGYLALPRAFEGMGNLIGEGRVAEALLMGSFSVGGVLLGGMMGYLGLEGVVHGIGKIHTGVKYR